jgi:iron(III) transport system substrate-binding protein
MLRLLPLAALLGLALGCGGGHEREVVVYAALDREFSEPILDDFERASDIKVLAKYDVESTKTIGLVTALIQERNRPRCDLFWNNEILHTIRLEKLGLLEPFTFPGSDEWPQSYRSPKHTWYGLAARARVIIVNTKLVPEADRPRSIRELADPKWKNKCGLAKPLFGTTATHAAVLFAEWGDEEAKQFFGQVKGNAQILSGNKQVALAVSSGQIAWGLTDTDDAIIEIEQHKDVAIIYPDQGEHDIGALFIPNTIMRIKGSPHSQPAGELARYIFDEENGVEKKLAEGPSAQFPLNPAVKLQPRVAPQDKPLKHMEVDFASAAEKWDAAAEYLKDTFATAE